MKNNNKFLVKPAKRMFVSYILIASTILSSFNFFAIMASANGINRNTQITNEESVFNTNSVKNNVIEGNIKRFDYVNTNLKEKSTLQEAIYEEITDRIDVCKANTEIADTTNNIQQLASAIKESKQERDAEEKRAAEREAEIAVCNAADGNVPNGLSECDSNFKTYMPYTAVTAKSSDQYKLLYSNACYTDPTTGIRMVDGRYCIAVGTGYCSKIGTKIDLVLDNGNILNCILGDIKADCDTDGTNRYHTIDGSVAEFIVDYKVFNKIKDSSGSVNFLDGFNGIIKKIVVLD